AREEVSGEAPSLQKEVRPASGDGSSEARLPPREASSDAADRIGPDEATSSPVAPRATTSTEPERLVAAVPNQSLVPRRKRGVRSLLTYVGLALALVLMLGSVAVLTRSAESGDPANHPASQAPNSPNAAHRQPK